MISIRQIPIKPRHLATYTKWSAALLLALAALLPLSEGGCSPPDRAPVDGIASRDSTRSAKTSDSMLAESEIATTDSARHADQGSLKKADYLREWIEHESLAWQAFWIALFVWPAPLLYAQSRLQNPLAMGVSRLALPAAAAYSAYCIELRSWLFTKPMLGSNLAVIANGALFLVGCVELLAVIVDWWVRRRRVRVD
jgi:hypothetical protein